MGLYIHMRIMENNMETAGIIGGICIGIIWGYLYIYIGIMEKNMETTI